MKLTVEQLIDEYESFVGSNPKEYQPEWWAMFCRWARLGWAQETATRHSSKRKKVELTHRQWCVVIRALELIEIEDISNGDKILRRWGLADREVLKRIGQQIGIDVGEPYDE